MPLFTITSLVRSSVVSALVLLGCAAMLSAQTDPATARPGSSMPSGQNPAQPGRGTPNPSGKPGQDGVRPPELWWREASPISKDLGLAREQSTRIEKIFQDQRPELSKLDNDLRKRESMLSDLIKDDATEAAVTLQIERVETTRSALNKTRQLMVYHMRQVLTVPQRAKFEVLHAQWLQEQSRADLERQQRDQRRQQQQLNQNGKPDSKSSPEQRGRPGF